MSHGLRWIGLWIALHTAPLMSAELPESFQFHGFVSQAAIKTTGNNFFGDTKDKVDFDFRELGINGSWRALPNLQLSLQAVSRWAGETDDGDLRIDYGFLDYSFLSNADNLWGVRAGRIMNPLGFYNDTRDVAFTRPSILLPQSIYFDRNRNLSLSADGIHLYGERRTNEGDFFFQFGSILPRARDPDLINDLTRGFGGDLNGKPSWITRLIYERDSGKFRFALSGGQLNVDIRPNNPRSFRKFYFEPFILSIQYNTERWSLTSEYALRYARLGDAASPGSTFSSSGESYYLQATYRFKPEWEALLRYDKLIWDKHDRDGKKFEAASGGLIPAHRRFANDWTFGLRWDITPSFMLRAEYHLIDGTGWVSALENRDGFKENWSLFAILGSYRF
jgi:hypothetical protein